MELWTIFWTALVVGFSGAMMPGPLLTVTIGASVRRGFTAGPLIVLGHAILEIVLVLLLVLGLAQFLASEWVTTVIALVGGAFLVYMGWSMTRDAWRGRVSLDLGSPGGSESATVNSTGISTGASALPGANQAATRANAPRPGMHPVAAGILVSLSNPYFTFWWATVGLAFITTAIAFGTAGLAAFTTGHLLSDLIWYSLVSGAVAGGRRFMSQQVYRGIIAACGVFLVGLGAYFFIIRGIA